MLLAKTDWDKATRHKQKEAVHAGTSGSCSSRNDACKANNSEAADKGAKRSRIALELDDSSEE